MRACAQVRVAEEREDLQVLLKSYSAALTAELGQPGRVITDEVRDGGRSQPFPVAPLFCRAHSRDVVACGRARISRDVVADQVREAMPPSAATLAWLCARGEAVLPG